MMFTRLPLAVTSVCVVAAVMVAVRPAVATDRAWDGGGGNTNWNTSANWNPNFVPSARFSERAVIGTNTVAGGLADPTVEFTTTPVPSDDKATGGLVLGREAGTSGTLTISGGTMTHVTTAGAASAGADGAVRLGIFFNGSTPVQGGRGFLTMTGGTLSATGLFVEGEQPAGQADSAVYLSGTATVTLGPNLNPFNMVTAGIGDNNLTFGRDLTITGPDVVFTNDGVLRFLASSSYFAQITSATAHSSIKTTGDAVLGGELNISFIGLATNPAVGQTWDLIDFGGFLSGSFSNVTIGDEVTVPGLPEPVETGAVFRLRQTTGGTNGKLVQLIQEAVLVLHVDRDSGEISITNPHGGPIAIEQYLVRSPVAGSLLASYDGITDADPPIAGAGSWAKPLDGMGQPLNNANALTEFLEAEFDPPSNPPPFDLTSVPSVPLGLGFDKLAVGDNPANFGMNGEDLIFEYAMPDGRIVRGQVEYIGTPFENDLVLLVNPNTGDAFLKNDSHETLTFDGYTIKSSEGGLEGTSFTGLGGTWETTLPTSSDAITQTNLGGATTLDPDDELSIGKISTNALTAAEQDGLSLEFILFESLVPSGPPAGDYNNNGIVDAADFTTWRDRLGQSFTLTNENPDAATSGVVDQEDYDFWKTQFGATSGLAPEETFRLGAIVFDTNAGAGSLAATSVVPEPSASVLMLLGLAAACCLPRRNGVRTMPRESARVAIVQRSSGQIGGVGTMSRHFEFCLSAVIAVVAALFVSLPAAADTGGIPLENQDFNLPGGSKVRPFDVNGTPYAPTAPVTTVGNGDRVGGIPGWTFSGPGVEVRFNAIDEMTMMPYIKGDSSTEPGGDFGPDAGNHLTLSTLDGTVYQTSGVNVASITANQKYQLAFDARDAFTIDGGDPTFMQIQNRAQLTAWLYYVNTMGARIPFATAAYNLGSNPQSLTVEIAGGGLPGAAVGRPLGVEFDNTTIEFNQGMEEFPVAHSWITIDNLLLQVVGTMAGDLNGDGDVNTADYAILRDNQQLATFYQADGDLNGDGIVNLNDFRAFKTIYSSQPPGAASGGLAGTAVPEPSTLALVLLTAIAAVTFRVRSQWGRVRCGRVASLAALVVAALLASASPSAADLLYYDPFNIGTNPSAGEYTLGRIDPTMAENDGQNPTPGPTDFFTGPWQIRVSDGDGPNVDVQPVEKGLAYLGAPAEGGSVISYETQISPGVRVGGRAGRFLADPWDDQKEGTFYIGYQASYGVAVNPTGDTPDPNDNLGFRTTEFWPVGNVIGQDDGRSEVGFQGYAGDDIAQRRPFGAQLRWIPGGGYTLPHFLTQTVFNEFAGTHLIVLKYELSTEAGGDVISVFLDPVSTLEPEIPTASQDGLDYTLGAISTISYFGQLIPVDPENPDVQRYPVFDELRVATTFEEAIPELPKPGDTNGDGEVDMLDYTAIITHLNLTGQTTANGDVARADGKQGSDGRVDLRDLNLWRRSRTDLPGGTAAGLGVPEPTSLILALAAAAAWAGCARRRR